MRSIIACSNLRPNQRAKFPGASTKILKAMCANHSMSTWLSISAHLAADCPFAGCGRPSTRAEFVKKKVTLLVPFVHSQFTVAGIIFGADLAQPSPGD
jgi:hypothetical protein